MGNKQLGYHFIEGFKSIFSHGLMSFAAVCMIVACLLIMGSFSLIAVNADNMLSDLEKDNQFLAYVDESLTEESARALQSAIEQVENVDPRQVKFVSRDEAMENFKQSQDMAQLTDVPASVLRHRFEIHVLDIQQMKQTTEAVGQINGIAEVKAQLEIAQGFVTIRNVATAMAVILVVMLVTISLFIIANTIKLATFTRREEIAIMKMCGATDWFVRWPFIFEGILLGLFGALVAFGLQWGLYNAVETAVVKTGSLQLITMLPFGGLAPLVVVLFLLAGFLIGACGSVMAIRKFLRV